MLYDVTETQQTDSLIYRMQPEHKIRLDEQAADMHYKL